MSTMYTKINENEIINPGDVITLVTSNNKVRLSRRNDTKIIGICVGVEGNNIEVIHTGITDVNTNSIMCLGDRLTLSTTPGKACAIKYVQESTISNNKNIGKVIGIYNRYGRVKVLLNL